jgi:hypothetical protein
VPRQFRYIIKKEAHKIKIICKDLSAEGAWLEGSESVSEINSTDSENGRSKIGPPTESGIIATEDKVMARIDTRQAMSVDRSLAMNWRACDLDKRWLQTEQRDLFRRR